MYTVELEFWVRLLIPLVTAIISILLYAFGRHWYDKRTKHYKRLRAVLGILFLLMMLVTMYLEGSDYISSRVRHTELSTKLDSIVTLYQPIRRIADSLYLQMEPLKAIELLASRFEVALDESTKEIIEKSHETFERDLYSPTKSASSDSFVVAAASLLDDPSWLIRNITLTLEEGNRERLLLINDLGLALTQAGYNVKRWNQRTGGAYYSSALVVRHSPNGVKQWEKLAKVLSLRFTWTEVDIVPQSSLKPHEITIEFRGNPVQDRDGNWTLR